MSEPFVAEIKMFAGNFAPRGWAFCNGQLLPVSQNTGLFALLGTNYGGNGKTTFGLPDLQGRAPMQTGQGLGLSRRDVGDFDGVNAVTLNEYQMPNHTHSAQASESDANENAPSPSVVLATTPSQLTYADGPPTQLAADTLAVTGGGLPHDNMQPFLTINFIIALTGIFPQRS